MDRLTNTYYTLTPKLRAELRDIRDTLNTVIHQDHDGLSMADVAYLLEVLRTAPTYELSEVIAKERAARYE